MVNAAGSLLRVWLIPFLIVLLTMTSCESVPEFDRSNPVDPSNPSFAPRAIGALKAAYDGSAVTLTWADSSDQEDGYLIERALDSSGVFVEIVRIGKNTTTYNDPVAVDAFTAQYRVAPFVSRDGHAVSGEYRSVSVPLTLLVGRYPNVDIASERSMLIRWPDLLSFETSYVVERSDAGGAFVPRDTLPANATQLQDRSPFMQGVTYAYRVVPYRDTLRGPTSSVTQVTMFITPPLVLSFWVAENGQQADFTWAGSPKAEGFLVERFDGQQFSILDTLPSSTNHFTDTELDTSLQRLRYRVRTLISGPTPEVSATYAPAYVPVATLSDGGSVVASVAFTADGQGLLAASTDGILRVWSVATWSKTSQIQFDGYRSALSIHPSRTWVLVASEGSGGRRGGVQVLDYLSGAQIERPSSSYYVGAFNDQGTMICLQGEGSTVYVRMLDTHDTVSVMDVPHSGGIYSARFSPDGTKLLVGCRDGLGHLFDVASGAFIRTFSCPPTDLTSVRFNSDGTLCLLPGGYSLGPYIFPVDGGDAVWKEWTQTVRVCDFLPDGTVLTVGYWQSIVQRWNVSTHSLVMEGVGHTNWINGIAASPIAAILATASDDGTVIIWNVGKKWVAD